MIQKFIFNFKVYAIKLSIEEINPDESVVFFKNLNTAQAFFHAAGKVPSVSDDLLKIAYRILNPAWNSSTKNTNQTDQMVLEKLCAEVFSGDLILVEIRPPKSSLRFEECCVHSMKEIDKVIGNSRLLGVVLCIGQVNGIFASHPKLPAVIGALSSAYQATSQDWEEFARAVASVPTITKGSVRRIAYLEYQKHYIENSQQELGKYWKKIYEDFE